MQINLTGFLNGKHARIFMGELWQMLDSAQKNESGIPQELLDLKVRIKFCHHTPGSVLDPDGIQPKMLDPDP
jgi:hypothetical protein